jgi:hypothetical protein
MTAAHWHLVRCGHTQLIGSQRQVTGDPFQFLPLFRTHREADLYCRRSGLWEQGMRPRHNSLAALHETSGSTALSAGLSSLVGQSRAEGVSTIGVFVGFNLHQESCWEYYRISGQTAEGVPRIEPLPEDERPV